jgi:hypothetical protein
MVPSGDYFKIINPHEIDETIRRLFQEGLLIRKISNLKKSEKIGSAK